MQLTGSADRIFNAQLAKVEEVLRTETGPLAYLFTKTDLALLQSVPLFDLTVHLILALRAAHPTLQFIPIMLRNRGVNPVGGYIGGITIEPCVAAPSEETAMPTMDQDLYTTTTDDDKQPDADTGPHALTSAVPFALLDDYERAVAAFMAEINAYIVRGVSKHDTDQHMSPTSKALHRAIYYINSLDQLSCDERQSMILPFNLEFAKASIHTAKSIRNNKQANVRWTLSEDLVRWPPGKPRTKESSVVAVRLVTHLCNVLEAQHPGWFARFNHPGWYASQERLPSGDDITELELWTTNVPPMRSTDFELERLLEELPRPMRSRASEQFFRWMDMVKTEIKRNRMQCKNHCYFSVCERVFWYQEAPLAIHLCKCVEAAITTTRVIPLISGGRVSSLLHFGPSWVQQGPPIDQWELSALNKLLAPMEPCRRHSAMQLLTTVYWPRMARHANARYVWNAGNDSVRVEPGVVFTARLAFTTAYNPLSIDVLQTLCYSLKQLCPSAAFRVCTSDLTAITILMAASNPSNAAETMYAAAASASDGPVSAAVKEPATTARPMLGAREARKRSLPELVPLIATVLANAIKTAHSRGCCTAVLKVCELPPGSMMVRSSDDRPLVVNVAATFECLAVYNDQTSQLSLSWTA